MSLAGKKALQVRRWFGVGEENKSNSCHVRGNVTPNLRDLNF